MNRTLRATAAVASALAIAFLGVGAPSALAAPAPAPNGPASIVDPNAGVQLNVHKLLGTATAAPNNGTVQTVAGTPVSGVNFDVYRVAGVDLTTNAGWTAAAAIAPYRLTQADIAARSFTAGGTTYAIAAAPVTVTTGTDGLATFNQGTGGVGLYLVNENLGSSGTVESCPTTLTCAEIPKTAVTASYPFFVTLPMTQPTDLNAWMYEVNVYPKNQQDTAIMTVADQGTQTLEGTGKGGAHDVTFTITTSITDGMTGPQMGQYVITDTLDSRLGTPTETVSINDGTGTLTPLVAGTDYTVTYNAGTGTVVIAMTPAGLDKLAAANAANPAASVVTTITAPVRTEGTGTITNQAYVVPNQAWYDANLANCPTCVPGVPMNVTPTAPAGVPTVTKYGDLRITKAAVPAAPPATMVGAEFAVHLDPTPASGCLAADLASPVVATAVTGATGTATVLGLQTSDFYNGGVQTALQQYCLVETKAPTGYNLNPQAVQFTIRYNTETLTDPAAPAFVALTINNERANLGNSLPLTGGEGVAALSAGGLLLVGGGLGYYLVSSRRRRHEA